MALTAILLEPTKGIKPNGWRGLEFGGKSQRSLSSNGSFEAGRKNKLSGRIFRPSTEGIPVTNKTWFHNDDAWPTGIVAWTRERLIKGDFFRPERSIPCVVNWEWLFDKFNS
jgi:hypothetical protein